MQDILINWSPQETRVALVENGAVAGYRIRLAISFKYESA